MVSFQVGQPNGMELIVWDIKLASVGLWCNYILWAEVANRLMFMVAIEYTMLMIKNIYEMRYVEGKTWTHVNTSVSLAVSSPIRRQHRCNFIYGPKLVNLM